jgi:uncharacterized protein (DUF169 family)
MTLSDATAWLWNYREQFVCIAVQADAASNETGQEAAGGKASHRAVCAAMEEGRRSGWLFWGRREESNCGGAPAPAASRRVEHLTTPCRNFFYI